MTLCSNCERLNLLQVFASSKSPTPSSLPPRWMLSESFALVRKNAATCPFCSLLVYEFGKPSIHPLSENSSAKDEDCVMLMTFTRDRWPRVEGQHAESGFIAGLEVATMSDPSSGIVSCVRHLPIWVDEGAPEVLLKLLMLRAKGDPMEPKMMQKWLDTCQYSHFECRIPSPITDLTVKENDVPLPTRVLDIGSEPSSQEVRLRETNGEKGQYVALSHCWGPIEFLVTKHENIDKHKQQINLCDLTANFRDAIRIARLLGYRYIWIDSLCIIQEDAQDWEAESAKMASVYTNASLTIAAASNAASHEGFLQPRKKRRSVNIPFWLSPGIKMGQMTIGESTTQDLYHDTFRQDVQEGPLAKRGWTLQERLLSRRTLFFGHEELHWECRSARWSESTRLRSICYADIGVGLAAFKGVPIFPSSESVDKHQLLNDWYMVLQEFTKRLLTKSTDKLPALSGVAKVVHRAFGSDASISYLAGLWSHDMPRALLWKTLEIRPDTVGGELAGPSWSWTCRSARIFAGRDEPEAVVDISDVKWDLFLAGNDPHGMVHGGTISFQGYIKSFASVTLILPRPEVRAPYPPSNALLYDQKGRQVGAAVFDNPDDTSLMEHAVFGVPVRHILNQHGAILRIQALLLQKNGESVYRRVGVADMMGSNRNDAPFAAPFQAFFYGAPKEEVVIE